MSPDKCLIVVVEDRHCDVEVKVFTGDGALLRALEDAAKVAYLLSRGRPEDIRITLSSAQERCGYRWFAAVGPEGDCVRVQEVPLNLG